MKPILPGVMNGANKQIRDLLLMLPPGTHRYVYSRITGLSVDRPEHGGVLITTCPSFYTLIVTRILYINPYVLDAFERVKIIFVAASYICISCDFSLPLP